jgi:hypothetical protein
MHSLIVRQSLLSNSGVVSWETEVFGQQHKSPLGRAEDRSGDRPVKAFEPNRLRLLNLDNLSGQGAQAIRTDSERSRCRNFGMLNIRAGSDYQSRSGRFDQAMLSTLLQAARVAEQPGQLGAALSFGGGYQAIAIPNGLPPAGNRKGEPVISVIAPAATANTLTAPILLATT